LEIISIYRDETRYNAHTTSSDTIGGRFMSKELPKELPQCPVEITLSLISNRWKVLILRDLMDGAKRFGELRKSLGNITQKVLTSNLREMEEDHLIIRTVYAEVPPRVDYQLTDLGYSLKPILESMKNWGSRYRDSAEEEVEGYA
jgi:transcriptional regulator, marR family (fragment)